VGPGYKQERIWGEYFWLWLTIFVAIAVYLPLFLWNQGYITIDEQYWWKAKWYWKASGEDGEARERPRASSLAILAYVANYFRAKIRLISVLFTLATQLRTRSLSSP